MFPTLYEHKRKLISIFYTCLELCTYRARIKMWDIVSACGTGEQEIKRIKWDTCNPVCPYLPMRVKQFPKQLKDVHVCTVYTKKKLGQILISFLDFKL